MLKIHAKLSGQSPYSQSQMIRSQKKKNETHEDLEKRAWHERMHIDKEGYVFIPAMQFLNAIKSTAKYMSMQIPGKGKATYTKHFEAGLILLNDACPIGIKADTVDHEWLHVPSDGMKGGGKRVMKCFPRIEEGWETSLSLMVVDDVITPQVFEDVLRKSGLICGIGRFRPANGGFYGRYIVGDIDFSETD
jgi:hypothetical protein